MMSYINKNNLMPERSRLFCPIERTNEEMYFSLVDYRNNYFTSSNPDEIIEFYNGFDNREQLIQCMKERPKGVATLHEVEGDKEIIVVIPTADFNGKYARGCRENIFKGLHIVFVESGGREDLYFNYAHNCNVGIKKAMEYSPKWVVVSNDDMVKVDNVSVLLNNIRSIDNAKFKIVYVEETNYHSVDRSFGLLRRYIGNFGYFVASLKFGKKITNVLLETRVNKKIGAYWVIASNSELINKIFFKKTIKVKLFGSFFIISSALIREFDAELFDESFINDYEDLDLSYRLMQSKAEYVKIQYRIGDMIGTYIGNLNGLRPLRDIANRVFYTIKHDLKEN